MSPLSRYHPRTPWKRSAVAGAVLLATIAAAVLLAPARLHAAESTNLAGTVAGIELCPQLVCGSAVFAGRFDGVLDGAEGTGTWWVTVTHQELPRPGDSAPITGGTWGMVVGERPLGGVITTGTILNNGDGTFTVTPRLDVREGGEGTLSLSLVLDHAGFPPTVSGRVGTGSAGGGSIGAGSPGAARGPWA